jgi:hypothetical protein
MMGQMSTALSWSPMIRLDGLTKTSGSRLTPL